MVRRKAITGLGAGMDPSMTSLSVGISTQTAGLGGRQMSQPRGGRSSRKAWVAVGGVGSQVCARGDQGALKHPCVWGGRQHHSPGVFMVLINAECEDCSLQAAPASHLCRFVLTPGFCSRDCESPAVHPVAGLPSLRELDDSALVENLGRQ